MINTASEAIELLKAGNRNYIENAAFNGDISPVIRQITFNEGQKPYAIIVSCSDSRVIPEVMFSAGIGDLFVIRVAGNVIDNHQLGSIEYAADHLGCKLVLVLGHTHCGAVDAAINHDPDGFIQYITDEIKQAIGEETDDYRACCLNVRRSIETIEHSLEIQKAEKLLGIEVHGAVYDIVTGKVEFLGTE